MVFWMQHQNESTARAYHTQKCTHQVWIRSGPYLQRRITLSSIFNLSILIWRVEPLALTHVVMTMWKCFYPTRQLHCVIVKVLIKSTFQHPTLDYSFALIMEPSVKDSRSSTGQVRFHLFCIYSWYSFIATEMSCKIFTLPLLKVTNRVYTILFLFT